jgi:hypothetical protein
MPQIKRRNGIEPLVGLKQTYIEHFGQNQVATDGIQYSNVVTIGTSAVEVFNKLIDPGYPIDLDELEIGLTQRFIPLGVVTASLSYYWKIRSEGPFVSGSGTPVATTMSYYEMTGTYTKGVATTATGVEDTFSGYIPKANVPRAPFRVVLTAQGLSASVFTGKVKNSSFVQFSGTVIPGA